MNKTRRAFTHATILLTAAAPLVTLVASSHVPSSTRAATTAVTLFSDGFESGTFSAWSVVKTGADGTATVQSSVVKSGSYAAQLSETSASGSYAYASKTLAAAQSDLTATGDFDVTVQGASGSNVRLFRLFDGSGAQVASVYRQNQTAQLGVQYGGAYYVTSGKIALNAWASVALHVVTAGSGASTVQVWLNGSPVYQVMTATLGTAGVLTAQIGNTTPSQPSAAYVDNVVLTTPATASATSTPTTTPTLPPATATSTPTTMPVATNTSIPPTPGGGHAIQTVFLILMENHNWSSIKGNPSAPYINNTLLPMASHAEQYDNPPGNHPSLPNYLWLEAGTNFGITDDNPPISHTLTTTNHLVTLLSAAGISWKAYEESISGTTCPLTDSYPYTVRHDPVVYFNDVTNNQSLTSPTCLAHVRPYTELATDLANNTVARYNFITPNVCDDMHDPCAPISDTVKQGDTWLQNDVPAILSSPAYKTGGALFITWDEGENGTDGPIGMIVLSPYARGNGYLSTLHYTHSSMLRTLEEIFGVSPWLGDAVNATDLRDLFSTFP